MSTGDGNESSRLHGLQDLQDPSLAASFSEISFDAVVAFDAQERVTFWNPAAEQIFGWTAQEALGKTPAELFWPVDMPLEHEYRNGRLARLRRGETLRSELNPCRKDGSIFPAQYTARAIFDAEGKITGYLAAYRDITAQVQARESEGKVKQSNLRLNEILASIQDDFYVLNRDWVFVFASRTFTSRIGKEPEDFVGKNIWEMFPKHVGGILYENFHAAMEKREIRRFEIPGSYTDAWYSMAAFPSADGITVLGADITRQKQAEREITESRRKYQDLIETISDFIWEMDPQGRYTYCSPQMENLWGLKPQDMLGKTPFDVMPPEEREKTLEYFRNVAGFAIPFRGLTTTSFNSQGELIFIETSGVPFFDQNGELLGFRGVTRDITGRKRAEQELQRSEERYRHLVKYAPSGIYEIDIQTTRFTEVNDIMCEILGYTREELLSTLPEELLEEESRARFRQRVLQTLAGEKIAEQTEYKVRARDGHEVWVILNITINYEQGKPKSVSVIAHDITERKQAEAALRESEERYRRIIESTHEGVWILDLNGITTYVNPQMAALLGYTPEDMIGHNAFDFVIPDDTNRGQTEWEERRQESRGRQSVYGYRHRDGHTVWCLVNSSPIMDTQGKALGVLGMFTDITERRQAEEVLRQQAQLLNLSSEAIFVWEFGSGIRYWNKGAERLYGYSSSEVIGKVSHELLATQDPKGGLDFLRVLEGEGEWRGELLHRTRDGRILTLESNQQVIDQGGRRLVLETNRDITERKRAEDALRESERRLQMLNESLEQKVQEKTAEMRRLASDTTKAVQRERHRISHILHDDLQQRIYALQMQLTFLRYELQMENENAHNELSHIEENLGEVLEITRHLSIDLSPPILRDEGLAHAISWLAGQMVQRYGLPVDVQADGTFAIPEEELHVFLFNCVRELLFNAVKHSGASRAVVVLRWLNAGLQIEVRDNGRGFSVSSPEQQAGGEESRQSSFGLPTIRKQLSLFGGRMEILSEPGKGTQILLYVPVSGAGG